MVCDQPAAKGGVKWTLNGHLCFFLCPPQALENPHSRCSLHNLIAILLLKLTAACLKRLLSGLSLRLDQSTSHQPFRKNHAMYVEVGSS